MVSMTSVKTKLGSASGISSDTAEFAVAAIRQWWKPHGSAIKRYATANRLLITADSGGSNSSRSRLWKLKLQEVRR